MQNKEILEDAVSVHLAKTKSAGLRCECFKYGTIEDEIADIGILFLGRAAGPAISIGADDDGLEWFATPFKVNEVLKGRMPKNVKLVHPQDSQACGTQFPTDREILWCAYRGKLTDEEAIDTTYYTDGCAEPQFELVDYRRVLG